MPEDKNAAIGLGVVESDTSYIMQLPASTTEKPTAKEEVMKQIGQPCHKEGDSCLKST